MLQELPDINLNPEYSVLHPVSKIIILILTDVIQTFLNALQTLEAEITHGHESHDLDHFPVTNLMALVTPNATAMPPAPNLDKNVAPHLCSLLCAYRLADVLYSLQDPAPTQNPRYGKHSLADLWPKSTVGCPYVNINISDEPKSNLALAPC